MLLDDLVGVIETLKERIAAHGVSLRENETRTRMALIDPLLQALGWDVSDPAMVTPEYSVGASRADYALLTPTGTPSALVEAKKLDESLASHRMQMLNYANMSGIPHAGLTDGNHWEMYTVFDQAPIEQRRILDVSIASTPAHEAALKLLLLWRPNLASGQPVAANAPVVDATTNARPVESDLPKPTDDALVSTNLWVSLENVNPSNHVGPPTAVRFSGTEIHRVARWQDVVVKILEYLLKENRFSEQNCPWGNRGYERINTVPSRANGRPFRSPEQIVSGIYVETSGNRHHLMDRSRNLWKDFRDGAETVELRFG